MAEQLTNCACSALHGPLLSTSLLRLREHVEKEAEIFKNRRMDGDCGAMLPVSTVPQQPWLPVQDQNRGYFQQWVGRGCGDPGPS